MRPTLDLMVSRTRQRLPELESRRSELEAALRGAAPPPPWVSGVLGSGRDVAVIAEIKRRSPSNPTIAPALDPAAHARAYARGGARGISVLTEPVFFGGAPEDLTAARTAGLPLLRKDFIMDPLQIVEARLLGASAVLLIVRAMEQGRLEDLAGAARSLGLATLVEVHERSELERALRTEPDSVGVNARDLEDFTIDHRAVAELLPEIPEGVMRVAESGIAGRDDVARAAIWGADAVLVGTSVAGAREPEAAVRALSGVPRDARTLKDLAPQPEGRR